jgi:SAM-dependent methyltransferase
VSASPARLEAIWHDVECGAYAADLAAWRDLASGAAGPVLELGCGTGRVALDLAEAGYEVVGLDHEPALLEELSARATVRGLAVESVSGDATRLGEVEGLGTDAAFGAIFAPMQLVHVIGGPASRGALLDGAAALLRPGGIVAAAVLAPEAFQAIAEPQPPLLPDVRELDGWVYSSQPTGLVAVEGGIEIRRLRQAVSPAGALSDEPYSIQLDELGAGVFEAEAQAAGLRPRGRIDVPPTGDHVGSVICVVEAP